MAGMCCSVARGLVQRYPVNVQSEDYFLLFRKFSANGYRGANICLPIPM